MALDFINYKVAPEGRNKYGNYFSSENVTLKVTKTTYGGNSTTEDLGGGENGGNNPQQQSYYMFLQNSQGNFNGGEVALMPQTATTQVIAYVGTEGAPVFIGNPTLTGTSEEDGSVIDANVNYSISGIPESGITVSVIGNGTTGTTLQVVVDSAAPSTGTLTIPCNMPLNAEVGMGDDIVCWNTLSETNSLFSLALEWKWNISSNATSVYTLDLSNEIAGVNCDGEGNIIPGAIMPQCRATLYFGTDPVDSGVTYSRSINNEYHVPETSVTINPTTGELTITSGLSFEGTTLAIVIMAHISGRLVGVKTFNIVKNLPGENGEPATTRWLVLSADQVVYDPNNITTAPERIVAKCWKQEGGNAPVEDSATTIYWKYDNENSWTEYTGPVTNINVSAGYIEFALLNGSGTAYEHETVPILKNGTNGTGSSPYRLDLSNQSASINCNSGGTILSGAIRPECTATLYYGENPVTGVTYSIEIPARYRASGITISGSTGVLHFNTSAETPALSWSGSPLQITVSATVGGTLRGRAVMNVAKNLPGADGAAAVSYWLAPSADAIHVSYVQGDKVASPSTITCKAYKQVGEDAPVEILSADTPYIYWGYNTDSPSTRYTGQTITIDATKSYLCFQLYRNGTQYDIETIPILCDGQDGESVQGRQGAAVRGPYDWYSGQTTTQRRYCNGEGPLESDKDFIDIMLKDGVYYRCTTSYYGSSNDDWDDVKGNWTASDAPYNFVATQLLLAQNAKIFFLTGNELYLMDANGNITGGAAAGSGITFWAGSSIPSEGNFRVDYQGNIFANSGIFRGYIQMPYTKITELNHTGTTYQADDRAYLVALGSSTEITDANKKTLRLPAASSRLNGFTYEILVEPMPRTRSGSYTDSLDLTVQGGDTIYCYAFNEPTYSDHFMLDGGQYKIVCIPGAGTTYRWVITNVTGGLWVDHNGWTYMSTLLGQSTMEWGMINKIVTYPAGGTRPGSSDNAMYVEK